MSSCSPGLKIKADLALLPHSCSNILVTDTFQGICLRKGGSCDRCHSFCVPCPWKGTDPAFLFRSQTHSPFKHRTRACGLSRAGAPVAGAVSLADPRLVSPGWRNSSALRYFLYVSCLSLTKNLADLALNFEKKTRLKHKEPAWC